MLAEPAAAAGLAGLETALREVLVGPDEEVVVLVTGSGLKAPQFLSAPGPAAEVEASLDAVEAALRRQHAIS